MRITSNLAGFDHRLKQIGKELFDGVSAAARDKPWQYAFVDMRWTTKTGSSFAKLRIVSPDGTVSALLDTPFENVPPKIDFALHEVWKAQDKKGTNTWYGIKLRFEPDGKCELRFDYDPECSVDPTFFDD